MADHFDEVEQGMHDDIRNRIDEYEDYMGQTTGEETTICYCCQAKIKVKDSYPKWNKTQKHYLVSCTKSFNKQGDK